MASVRWVFPGTALLRPAAVQTARTSTRTGAAVIHQRRCLTRGPDDLGGPGGQEPPPSNPGGPEVIKRRWPLIGGGVLGVLALYTYLTTDGAPKKGELKQAARKGEAELKQAARKGEAELRDGVRKGEEGLRDGLKEMEGSAREAAAELRGKKGGMGGFRGE